MALFCSSQDFKNLYADISKKAEILRLQAKGGSMYPFIKSGDWVEALLRKEDVDLRKGEVILFEKDGAIYVHRVIKVRGQSVLTKGDLSFGPDGLIPRRDIFAKIVAVERNGRRIDLCSPWNRFVGWVLAVFYFFFQAVFLFLRKIAGGLLRFVFILQSVGIYRKVIKKIVKFPIVVVRAQKEDEEALKDLYGVGSSDIRRGMQETLKEGVWLVSKRNKKITGSIVISRHGQGSDFWLTHGLVVNSFFRGLGIGGELVSTALKEAETGGAHRVGLFVRKANKAAVSLYEKMGFRISSHFPSEFSVAPDEFFLVYDFSQGSVTDAFLLSLLTLFIKERSTEEEGLKQQSLSSVPWSILLESAKKEGVLHPFFSVSPEQVRREHKDIYYSYAAQGIHDLESIKRVLGTLEQAGVQAVVLKGWSVDSLIYSQGFYRPRADLDLVVKKRDRRLFQEAVGVLGYRPYIDKKGQAVPESSLSSLYVGADVITLPIHLHYAFFNNYYLSIGGHASILEERLWENAQPFGDYRNIFVMSPEMQLVFLCEHALKHNYDELVLLYELDRWVRLNPGLDWKKVKDFAQTLDFSSFVYYSLFFASRIFSTPVPQETLVSLVPARMTSSERLFVRDTLAFRRKVRASYAVYLARQKGFLKKTEFLWKTVFPPGFGFSDSLRRVRQGVANLWS